jgi:hypothetical protein
VSTYSYKVIYSGCNHLMIRGIIQIEGD